MASPSESAASHLKAIGWGVLSIALYLLLFIYDKEVLELSAKGKWYFVFPVVVAFLFSVVHGNFTGEFWRSLGIRAKR
ncbi:MAG: hypothetical protein HQM06_07935 [Magnetococcales bacterium]|nr:hypothetical protein [Magnetococcales bacterium]